MRLLPFVLLVILIPASAHALLVPLRTQAESFFPRASEDVHIASMSLRVWQERDIDGTRPGDQWEVDAEFAIRNRRSTAVQEQIGVIASSAAAPRTSVHARGIPVELTPVRGLHDGSLREHHYPDLLRFTLRMEPQELILLRLRTTVSARTDASGQVWVELPLHALDLFDDRIETAWIRIEAPERMMGFRASVTGWTLHDAPANIASWYIKDFRASRPFQAAWIGAWSLLLRVAVVEDCPAPWEVMRRIGSSRMEELRSLLEELDPDTRDFCGSQPLIVHGHVFRSERTRDQLGEILLTRYVPDAPTDSRVYRENAAFTRDQLTDVERIYMDTLTVERQGPANR